MVACTFDGASRDVVKRSFHARLGGVLANAGPIAAGVTLLAVCTLSCGKSNSPAAPSTSTAIQLVSRAASDLSRAPSTLPALSADGRHLFFTAGDEIYALDLSTEQSSLVTVRATEGGPAMCASGSPLPQVMDTSADGRLVLFFSCAPGLVGPGGASPTAGGLYLRDVVAGQTRLVIDGSRFSRSGSASMSNDGRYVAADSADGVLLNDLTSGAEERIDPAGSSPKISADGRHLVFERTGRIVIYDLANGDTIAEFPGANPSPSGDAGRVAFEYDPDVFVYDGASGTTTPVSVHATGGAGDAASSYSPIISGDGRYVAFLSDASDLVDPGVDTNGAPDVYLRDLQSGTTRLVSRTRTGVAAGISVLTGSGVQEAIRPAMSVDGGSVVFVSDSNELAADGSDTNDAPDVYVYDRDTDTPQLVSRTGVGPAAGVVLACRPADACPFRPGRIAEPRVSADGSAIAFQSASDDIVDTGRNGAPNVFVADRRTGATVVATAPASATTGGNADSGAFAVSAHGEVIAFESFATNLVAGRADRYRSDGPEVFARDLERGVTELISVAPDGRTGNGPAFDPRLSADGRYVAFHSNANDLVPGGLDQNDQIDLYVRDRLTGITQLASVAPSGTAAGLGPYRPCSGGEISTEEPCSDADPLPPPQMSADGRIVVFEPSDGGIFARDLLRGATALVRADGAGARVSANGRFVAFESGGAYVGINLYLGGDVYVSDLQTGRVQLVSVALDGTAAGGNAPAISADGRYVAFVSSSTQLVPGNADRNDFPDVYVRDMLAGRTLLGSANTDGIAVGANWFLVGSYTPETPCFTVPAPPILAGGGNAVAFFSNSGPLCGPGSGRGNAEPSPTPTASPNAAMGSFVRDLGTGMTRSAVGAVGPVESLSFDGRYAAYGGSVLDLVTGNLFMLDAAATRTVISSDGRLVAALSTSPLVSDATYLANSFSSDAAAVSNVFAVSLPSQFPTPAGN